MTMATTMNLIKFALNPEMQIPIDISMDAKKATQVRHMLELDLKRQVAEKIGLFIANSLMHDAKVRVPGKIRKELYFCLLLTDKELERFPKDLTKNAVLVDVEEKKQ